MTHVEMVNRVVPVPECAKIKTLVFPYVNVQLTAIGKRAHRMPNVVKANVIVVATVVAFCLVIGAPRENLKNVVEK
ncbi:hypothetical protein HA402_008074 [Bradysia odoriphaga]|nr:hypothetical protein HA402_008074 [Bradysia odoriphaga]